MKGSVATGWGGVAGVAEGVLLADAHGRFSLPVEHAGRWRLSGVARGYRTQALNQHDGFHEALVLSEQQPVATVTLRLDADAEVSGLVLDEAGEPVRQAQVIAEEVVPAVLGAGLPGIWPGFLQPKAAGGGGAER